MDQDFCFLAHALAHQTVQGMVSTQQHSYLINRGHKDQVKEKLQPGGGPGLAGIG
jgi:hypothetical protein